MATEQKIYRRYEKVFVSAYGVVIALILALGRFPGTISLELSALYKLAVVALAFNAIFYFAIPRKYIGRNKTILGIVFSIAFISFMLWFSGHDQSPFFFLYYLTILTSALYLGPRETILFAALISCCYFLIVRLAGHSLVSVSAEGAAIIIHLVGLAMITAFASILAHLIKRRERQTRSKAGKLSALNVLTQALTSTLEKEKIFDQVVRSIAELMNVPLCFLWTLEPDGEVLVASARKTTVELPPDAGRMRVGEGLVGWVAAHRQMIVLEDVLQDSRLQLREVAQELHFASYLAIPLMIGERLLGVLEIGTNQRRRFSQDEIDLLLSFAAQSAIALNNSQLFAQEDERNRRLGALKKYRDMIQMSSDESAVNKALTHALQREFNLEQIVIFKKNPSENRLEVQNLLRPLGPDVSLSVERNPGNCPALRSNRHFIMNDPRQDFNCPENCPANPEGSYLCIPFIVGGRVTGVAHLASAEKKYWTVERAGLAESFVEQTAPILSSLNLLRQAEQRAIQDSLTGLYNRRFLFEFMQQQIVQSKRYNQPLSILMLDLDHFKNVNDTYGHEAGDVVLKLFGLRLREILRESDIAARYGGEEFVVVLPNTNRGGALGLAEKIRAVTLQVNLAQVLPNLPCISVSIGVATFPINGETVEQLQRASDAALYQAKQSGRNRIFAAEIQALGESLGPKPLEQST